MYYLQSRYYDSKICRFINADSYVSTGQGVLGYNMFAYCGNNPVNYVDYTGEWFVVDDIAPLTLLVSCMVVMLGLIQDAMGDQILGNFVSDVVTQTAKAVNNLVNGIKSFSDSKANEKEKVEPQPSQYRYWKASIINGVVTPLEPLTYEQARDWAAAEQNLLCINRDAALAIVSYYPSAIWHPAHRGGLPCGYLNHYHLNKGHEHKHNNHIWYYGE